MSKRPIYLDYNSTTPLDERVLEAMLPYFRDRFGNAASSTHFYGWQAEEAVKIAREKVAALIGADPTEIIFTSGATEGINLALKGVADRYAKKGDHIITVATEHKAVLDACAWLEQQGKQVTYLPVDREGFIDLEELEAAMRAETILVCIMLVNNETGVIHHLEEISEIVHRHKSILMTDATQAVGKIPLNVDTLGVDIMAFSAHKFYGPKGVGGLYTRRRRPRVSLTPLIHGGGHERGFRSGTLNVPAIVGLGKAAEVAGEEMEADQVRMLKLRDKLEQHLVRMDEAHINGPRDDFQATIKIGNSSGNPADSPHEQRRAVAGGRLYNVSNISFYNTDADSLLAELPQIAMATGSACTSSNMEASHVLKAMGIKEEDAYASIRLSLGRFTTSKEIEETIQHFQKALEKLKVRKTYLGKPFG